ncbi:MAG: hypothetical protein II820_04110 [Ruminiclostridium sp.]|nr:hypothetical protein [Ruminiclostridium sp.]
MKVSLLPEESGILMQRDLFRLSTTLYADNSDPDVYSSIETQFQMIKYIISEEKNVFLSIDKLKNLFYDVFKYHISEQEVANIVENHKGLFEIKNDTNEIEIRLNSEIYSETVKCQKYNIDYYIDKYISEYGISDADSFKDAIHRYLYELTTTNINTYKFLIFGKDEKKYSDSELFIDITQFNEDDINRIHDFIVWHDPDKNMALGNIVFTCLEYCMLVNGDRPNSLILSSIRKREIYLDTNIIFRALGINGSERKKNVLCFLRKCLQAKIKIIISSHTKMEFDNTITYYLSKISAFPRGNIFPGAYEQISDYNLFSFYEDWRSQHKNLPFKFFEFYINSEYEKLIKKFKIQSGEQIPSSIYDSDRFKTKRNNYSSSISNKKQEIKYAFISDDYTYSKRDSHDATIITYIEYLRDNCKEKKDIFLVSSDKVLRAWDMARSEARYPVVIYPSQLFLVLIKLCGRSDDDFESFVSFINVRPQHNQISTEKANAILSGISTITEDIKEQKLILSAVIEKEYQNILNNNEEELFKHVQTFSQNYLEKELNSQREEIIKLNNIANENQNKIEALSQNDIEQKRLIEKLTKDINNSNDIINKKEQAMKEKAIIDNQNKDKMFNYAIKKIYPLFFLRRIIVPIILILICIVFIAFVFLQFFFTDWEYNFSVIFLNWLKSTYFGGGAAEYTYIPDTVFFAFVVFLMKKFMCNPFSKLKNKEYKMKKAEKYLKKYKLL